MSDKTSDYAPLVRAHAIAQASHIILEKPKILGYSVTDCAIMQTEIQLGILDALLAIEKKL